MRLVVDTNVIVGEGLRRQGREFLASPHLTLYQPEYARAETLYELNRRISIICASRNLEEIEQVRLFEEAREWLEEFVGVLPAHTYAPHEALARRRVPQDPNDWTLVAAALHLKDAGILTNDTDFLGCGLPTWTPATLRAEIGL